MEAVAGGLGPHETSALRPAFVIHDADEAFTLINALMDLPVAKRDDPEFIRLMGFLGRATQDFVHSHEVLPTIFPHDTRPLCILALVHAQRTLPDDSWERSIVDTLWDR